MSVDYPFPPAPSAAPRTGAVFFERRELDRILRLYGRMVAAGEWRDYAIGCSDEVAIFAVFRRTGETPLYRIEKRPALAKRQGAWAVISQNGVILRGGRELEAVRGVFDTRRFKVVD